MHEKVEELLEQPWFVPAAAGILGFCGGLGVGFLLGKRRKEVIVVETQAEDGQLKLEFDVYEDVKIDELPEVERTVRPPKVVISAEEAGIEKTTTVNSLADLRPSMIDAEDEDDKEDLDDEPDVVVTIAEVVQEDGWTYEEEIPKRDPNRPYVIHRDEFYADEMDLSQLSLTYYAIDNILADEDEKPVYNHHQVVGEMPFGYGSGDPDVVYVRNEKRHAEYEITRLDALYSVEVLGLEIENNQRVADLKHSKSMKFRME